jgi:hypothetical protein
LAGFFLEFVQSLEFKFSNIHFFFSPGMGESVSQALRISSERPAREKAKSP